MTRQIRILLVDDNALVLRALAAVLSSRYQVGTASNIDDAMVAFATDTPDVVVTDLDLGDRVGRNGLWLLERAPCPGLVLTGHHVAQAGFRVLRKPVQSSQIDSAIEELLKARGPLVECLD